MCDTILVGTDGSASANRAVVQAEQNDATLRAISVVDTSRYSEPVLSSQEPVTDDIEDWGHEQLGEITERAEELDIDIVTRSCHGKPHEERIEYTDQTDSDLIVPGYQGHSHTDGGRVGSITDRVVRNAGQPVLVIETMARLCCRAVSSTSATSPREEYGASTE